ncbi:hypothetical protein B4086_5742 [Bacillus cereus]|nr:hypothetical protein B4086_5742 [Bacillus cereus]
MKMKRLATEIGVPVKKLYRYRKLFIAEGYTFEEQNSCEFGYAEKEISRFKRVSELVNLGHIPNFAVRIALKGTDVPDVKVLSLKDVAERLGKKGPNVARNLKYLENEGYVVQKYDCGSYMLTEKDLKALADMEDLHNRGYSFKEGAGVVAGSCKDLSFSVSELVEDCSLSEEEVCLRLKYVKRHWGKKGKRGYKEKNGYYIFTEESYLAFKGEGEKGSLGYMGVLGVARGLGLDYERVYEYKDYLIDVGYVVKKRENGRYLFTEKDVEAFEYLADLHRRGYTYKEGAEIVVGLRKELSFTLTTLSQKFFLSEEEMRIGLKIIRRRWGNKDYREKSGYYVFSEESYQDLSDTLAHRFKKAI